MIFLISIDRYVGLGVKFVELLGADFKKQFDLESYKAFFKEMGYSDVEYHVVDGRMPCAVAVIKNELHIGKLRRGRK